MSALARFEHPERIGSGTTNDRQLTQTSRCRRAAPCICAKRRRRAHQVSSFPQRRRSTHARQSRSGIGQRSLRVSASSAPFHSPKRVKIPKRKVRLCFFVGRDKGLRVPSRFVENELDQFVDVLKRQNIDRDLVVGVRSPFIPGNSESGMQSLFDHAVEIADALKLVKVADCQVECVRAGAGNLRLEIVPKRAKVVTVFADFPQSRVRIRAPFRSISTAWCN